MSLQTAALFAEEQSWLGSQSWPIVHLCDKTEGLDKVVELAKGSLPPITPLWRRESVSAWSWNKTHIQRNWS